MKTVDADVLIWRKDHKKCVYCKYCDFGNPTITGDKYPWCVAKKKIINFPDIRRLCRVFKAAGDE